jgi:GNAT superfamily N-acetyltransferase
MIKIRVLKPSEYKKVKGLIGLIFPCAIVNLNDEDIMIIAELEGTPVGFAHLVDDRNRYLLRGIGVVDSMRNHGVGAMLLESSLGMVYGAGKPLMLKVKAMNPAVDLYCRYGFCLKRFGAVLTLSKNVEN